MPQKDNILEELRELNSSLASRNAGNIYQVPAGYFEGLAARVLGRIKALEANDAAEELNHLSPFLSKVSKQMPHAIPHDYFENLVLPVENKPARIVSLSSRKWFRYAAAAVITGIILMAGFLYMNDRSESGKRVLGKVKTDLKKMNEVEKDKLMDFMDAGLSGHETAQVSADSKSTIKELLQDVSDAELKDLNEQTEDIGDILMTN